MSAALGLTAAGARDYAYRMEPPMEELAILLEKIGADTGGGKLDDDQIVALATRKLSMLHEMVAASGVTPGILAACMKG